MKFRTTALALVLGLGFTAGASAVTIGFNPRTGDVWVDTQLRDMNQYGYSDRDYFIDDMVNNFGAPRYLITDLLVTRRWQPGDVYYACALAYASHRPCGDVVHMYEQDRGHGWGVIAQRMGIKPGSPEFFALKGQVGKSHGHFKEHGHGPILDRGPGDSGDHDPGNSNGHKEKHGNSQGGDHGDSGDHGQGNSGHDHGNSGDHGNGGGKGKSKKGGGH